MPPDVAMAGTTAVVDSHAWVVWLIYSLGVVADSDKARQS